MTRFLVTSLKSHQLQCLSLSRIDRVVVHVHYLISIILKTILHVIRYRYYFCWHSMHKILAQMVHYFSSKTVCNSSNLPFDDITADEMVQRFFVYVEIAVAGGDTILSNLYFCGFFFIYLIHKYPVKWSRVYYLLSDRRSWCGWGRPIEHPWCQPHWVPGLCEPGQGGGVVDVPGVYEYWGFETGRYRCWWLCRCSSGYEWWVSDFWLTLVVVNLCVFMFAFPIISRHWDGGNWNPSFWKISTYRQTYNIRCTYVSNKITQM